VILYTGLFDADELLVVVVVGDVLMLVEHVGGIIYAVRHYMAGGILCSEIAGFVYYL